MNVLHWLILLLPLASAAGIALFTLRQRELSAKISIAAVCGSFVLGLITFFASDGSSAAIPWLHVGGLSVDIGLQIDPLSKLMLLIVTGVGALIHIYSFGYMHEDRSVSRYFASLSLFTFSMLGIVLANNFVMMFIFWELVGVSSYLLIGFWYEKPAAADAAKKAFITNRLGDFGFILGIIMVWALLGTVNFDAIGDLLANDPAMLGQWATVAGLLIFCGTLGKSAQWPLHVWLPDAMEGPTPVSALIHAATMVAAGVYMLCRAFAVYTASQAWPEALSLFEGVTALNVIAWIGGGTALLAALIAVQQNDIKRILAYSTLSQLGYMVMAVGLAAPVAAMYHLTTHAFFKALLFLGAGSVIHALHHEQDIWKMGNLREKMPTTFKTFMLGTLALCGVVPLSGFYSKDAVIASALDDHHGSLFLFLIAIGVAVLTTFYMSRLVMVAFYGRERSESAGHARESPRIMTVPLVLLAIPTVIAGWTGLDAFLGRMLPTSHPVEHHGFFAAMLEPINHSPLAATFGLLAVLAGYLFARSLYRDAASDPVPEKIGVLSRAMKNRFYFDEVYGGLIRLTHEAVARLADWLDRWIVSGLFVRGLHGVVELLGRALRLAQTGNIQSYAFLLVAGIVVVILISLGVSDH